MLTVSLHGIRIDAYHGLYAEEQVLGNRFEVDVDVHMPTVGEEELPFVDYTLIRSVVAEVFLEKGQLLEKFVLQIHQSLRRHIAGAEKIKVAVRKLAPPMEGDIRYAQVCYEV